MIIYEYERSQLLYFGQKLDGLNKLIELAEIQWAETFNEIEGVRMNEARFKQLKEKEWWGQGVKT